MLLKTFQREKKGGIFKTKFKTPTSSEYIIRNLRFSAFYLNYC